MTEDQNPNTVFVVTWSKSEYLIFLSSGGFSVWKQIILSTITSSYHGKINLILRREVAVVSQETSKCELKSLHFLNLNTSSYFPIVNLLIEVVFFKNDFIIKIKC